MAGFEPLSILLLTLVSFAGSLITVTLGLGGGLLLLSVMATLLPPLALIPVHGAIQLGSNLNRAWLLRQSIYWPPLAAFAMGSVVGVISGGLIVADLPPWLIQLVVGGFIIWSLISKPPAWLMRWPAVTGIFSSFLTMFFGATGPFVANFIKGLDLPKTSYVATHGACMAVQHSLKVLVFALLGFAFTPWLGFIGLMIGAGFLGTLVGKRLLLQLPERWFRWALTIILWFLAFRLLWQGLVNAGL